MTLVIPLTLSLLPHNSGSINHQSFSLHVTSYTFVAINLYLTLGYFCLRCFNFHTVFLPSPKISLLLQPLWDFFCKWLYLLLHCWVGFVRFWLEISTCIRTLATRAFYPAPTISTLTSHVSIQFCSSESTSTHEFCMNPVWIWFQLKLDQNQFEICQHGCRKSTQKWSWSTSTSSACGQILRTNLKVGMELRVIRYK